MHVRAARRNGLTPDEIGAVLLQTAVYCGVPAANSAFAAAQRVLARRTAPPADSARVPRRQCLAGPRHQPVGAAGVREGQAAAQLGLRAGRDAVLDAGGGVLVLAGRGLQIGDGLGGEPHGALAGLQRGGAAQGLPIAVSVPKRSAWRRASVASRAARPGSSVARARASSVVQGCTTGLCRPRAAAAFSAVSSSLTPSSVRPVASSSRARTGRGSGSTIVDG